VKIYGEGACGFVDFLLAPGMATIAAKTRRDHVESFLEGQIAEWKPAAPPPRPRKGRNASSPMIE
jgi:hypothetical protein